MYEGKTVAVVAPCYNEEQLIGTVIETMPECVDRIIVIDDVSTDGTLSAAQAYADSAPQRVQVIRHEKNGGVGRAIVTGYEAALAGGYDLVAVMAGDAQMDPEDLPALLAPVAAGECDYAKGNRLFSGDAWKIIPRVRYLGNAVLSLMTKMASGYWHVADSQTGYTVIDKRALALLDLGALYPRYGFPNDMLVQLNIYGLRVHDVPIKPVYGVGEQSHIRLWKVIPTLSWLLFRRFWYRMFHKYIVRDTHPLVLFYITGNLFIIVGVWFGVLQVLSRLRGVLPSVGTTMLATLLIIAGLQFIFFAMWFDMDYNKELHR